MKNPDVSREWVRIGVMLHAEPAEGRVDLESLIVRSLGCFRGDARLFWCASSWLSIHHELINTRRLGKLLSRLEKEVLAVAGLLFEVAVIQNSEAVKLEQAIGYCQALDEPQIFFDVVTENEALSKIVAGESMPLFKRWGFLHYQMTDKRDAIRPISWILSNCPELRIRALIGATLEAEILEMSINKPTTATEISRKFQYTYSAVYAAVMRLVRRGLLKRQKTDREVYLVPQENVKRWLTQYSA